MLAPNLHPNSAVVSYPTPHWRCPTLRLSASGGWQRHARLHQIDFAHQSSVGLVRFAANREQGAIDIQLEVLLAIPA
jgi:hypothetical protein